MNKYRPLGNYLLRQQNTAASLTFQDIQGIIGFNLPQSACRYRTWWANSLSHPQAIAWLDVGWKVKSVDLDYKTVTFIHPLIITISNTIVNGEELSLKAAINEDVVEFILSGPSAMANTPYTWHQLVQTLLNMNPHLFGRLTNQPMHHVYPEMLAKLGYTVVNMDTGESWVP